MIKENAVLSPSAAMNFRGIIREYQNNYGLELEDFIVREEDFNRHSYIHYKKHVRNVMAFCLILGYKIGDLRSGLLAFIGAFVHDKARENDGMDGEHGERAAETKLPAVLDRIRAKYNLTDEECDQIASAVATHAIPQNGSSEKYLAYQDCVAAKILKDADALDRFRFGEHNLKREMLRFPESHDMIDYARWANSHKIQGSYLEAFCTHESL